MTRTKAKRRDIAAQKHLKETLLFYRPIKQPVTMRVDADVLTWLKAGGPGWQTRINEILRKRMEAAIRGGK